MNLTREEKEFWDRAACAALSVLADTEVDRSREAADAADGLLEERRKRFGISGVDEEMKQIMAKVSCFPEGCDVLLTRAEFSYVASKYGTTDVKDAFIEVPRRWSWMGRFISHSDQ